MSKTHNTPFRYPYEYISIIGCVFAVIVTLATRAYGPQIDSDVPFFASLSFISAIFIIRFIQWNVASKKRRMLTSGTLEFISFSELKKKMKKMNGSVWMGKGFEWTTTVANRAYYVMRTGLENIIGEKAAAKASFWMHAVGEKDVDIGIQESFLDGHTLIVGTTGAGKTRMFDLMITQAVLRNECVIIIDPKGDKELKENAKKACEIAGRPEAFCSFHPAFPDDSISIDPMRNWNRTTELASRLSALIPSETGADPFTAFGWKALNDVIQGLVKIEERPNLMQIRKYIEGGVDDLVIKALRYHFEHHIENWEKSVAPFIKQARNDLITGYVNYYKQLSNENRASELDGLVSGFEHNRDHFQKMIASLIPILNMLTADPLGKLLSPGEKDKKVDSNTIITQGMVAYIGLDSLSDSTVGSAIGSILLADLTAVAGDRYNYGSELKTVNIFIDEAAEVLNKPTIQLMNKGRGAKMRMTIATQTFADFVVRMGDEAQARQVLGNKNNLITLRVVDAETQKYIIESLPQMSIEKLEVQYRDGHSSSSPDEMSGMVGEGVTSEDLEAVSASMLGTLPNLHYFLQMANGRLYKMKIPILKEN